MENEKLPIEHTRPLPKEITDDIRSILEGIKSGELKHKQKTVHCGTAHCVCGWKAVLDYSNEPEVDPEIIYADFGMWRDSKFSFDIAAYCMAKVKLQKKRPHAYAIEWQYAQMVWQLTYPESMSLFDGNRTLDGMFDTLQHLEAGDRCYDIEPDYEDEGEGPKFCWTQPIQNEGDENDTPTQNDPRREIEGSPEESSGTGPSNIEG